LFECGDDTRGGESYHHCIERHEDEVDVFLAQSAHAHSLDVWHYLPRRPVQRVCWIRSWQWIEIIRSVARNQVRPMLRTQVCCGTILNTLRVLFGYVIHPRIIVGVLHSGNFSSVTRQSMKISPSREYYHQSDTGLPKVAVLKRFIYHTVNS
jgi:hypothetical protein